MKFFFDITATSNGHSNGGNTAAEHALFRRTNGIWDNVGTHNNATQTGNLNNAITAQRTDVQGLGDFIIGRGEYMVATNPVLHESFRFINAYGVCTDCMALPMIYGCFASLMFCEWQRQIHNRM